MHKAQHQGADTAQHDVQEKINCVWKEAVAQNFVVNKQRMGAIAEKITTKHNTSLLSWYFGGEVILFFGLGCINYFEWSQLRF